MRDIPNIIFDGQTFTFKDRPYLTIDQLEVGKDYIEHLCEKEIGTGNMGDGTIPVIIIDKSDKYLAVYLNQNNYLSEEGRKNVLQLTIQKINDGEYEIEYNKCNFYDEDIVVYYIIDGKAINEYVGELKFTELEEIKPCSIKETIDHDLSTSVNSITTLLQRCKDFGEIQNVLSQCYDVIKISESADDIADKLQTLI